MVYLYAIGDAFDCSKAAYKEQIDYFSEERKVGCRFIEQRGLKHALVRRGDNIQQFKLNCVGFRDEGMHKSQYLSTTTPSYPGCVCKLRIRPP